MIIFNTRELKSPYSKKESKMIEINSTYSLQDIYEKLVKGENLDPEKVVVNGFQFKDGELELYSNENNTNQPDFYNDRIFDDDVEYFYTLEYTRPAEFTDFEKYQFSQPHQNTYNPVNISMEELLNEIKAALGCPPTLMQQELTKEELSKYSSAVTNLICPKFPIGTKNPCPTVQELDHYISMNDYEKRLIHTKNIHPYKAFKIAETLKETISPKYIFSKDIYNRPEAKRDPELCVQVAVDYINNIFTQEEKTLIENAFKAVPEFHGFVPRVANEYIYGQLLKNGMSKNQLNMNTAVSLASQFSRNSVSKVANTKSPILLALASDIDFGQFPEKQRDVLGSYITEDAFKNLNRKEFIPWMNKNKDVNPAELVFLLENNDKIEKFSIDTSAKQLISEIKNAKGKAECDKFESDSYWKIKNKRFKFSDNELAIKGRHTVAKQDNITMRMLQADDYGHFTAGIDTTCCQRYNNAGESCVFKAVTDPFATTVVIEEGDKVKAQGFVWTDEVTDTLVFDNIEFCGNDSLDSQLSKKYLNIIQVWAEAMPYKNVHIGVGYNASMNGWGKKVTYQATLPTTVDNSDKRRSFGSGNCYSDYHNDARAIKKDGEMLLNRTNNVSITLETAPDEPTRWDELASPALSFLLNNCDKSIEERIEFAKKFLDNPDAVNQLEVIKINPKAIASIDNPAREVQLYILDNYPDLCCLINNPIVEIKYQNIKNDPYSIKEVPYSELTEDLIKMAVNQNGMTLQFIPNDKQTLEICTLAIENNANAAEFAHYMTDNLQIKIADNNPKVLLKLNCAITNNALLTALEKEPSLISAINTNKITHEMKILAIDKQPDLVFVIKNPIIEGETAEQHNAKIKELWKTAVDRNPNLIRNCGRSFPDFRMPAIEKNPYVVTLLPDSNKAEIRKAVELEPKVWQMIKHPERKKFAYEAACEIHGKDNVPFKKTPNVQRMRQDVTHANIERE